jgi:hypothetical protein
VAAMSLKRIPARRLARAALAVVVCAAAVGSQTAVGQKGAGAKASKPKVSAQARAAMEHISADSLRGHLSFIASDLLEGRGTPSRGQDLAAEYIAAQFRRAGLEPVGDDGYFQSATLTTRNAPDTPIKARNVAGLLRGSDPALRDTYVIVSAHYDHLGVREQAQGPDKIFNGANDDGSGTVSVVELAAALAQMKPHPKRSVLFVTFTGEERGLLGSRFYGQHPLVPIEKTVAQINLEQVGRTDDSEGPQVGTATVTGFDYSTVGATIKAAGDATGVKVYKHPTNSDAFFRRSDNQSLADLGVPAHTVGVAFEYPDYHGPADHWDKIDYANMERVARTVALAVLLIADDPKEPRWDESNPKTERFVKAWKEHHK